MNKSWDSDKGGKDEWIKWLTEVMSEVNRVLKSGGHGLVWSLPRTSHWTAMALENAGFEIRDCVYHIHGQGFPKSLNVSKGIDKKFKAERKVIGKENPFRDGAIRKVKFGYMDGNNIYGGGKGQLLNDGLRDRTAPSTDLAKKYD